MDFDQYVAARYGRLIEQAVLLGCAEGEAGAYVDQVLLDQRKRIGRSADPDPLVQVALARLIDGTPERSSRTGPLVAVALVAVAVTVGVVLTYRPSPEPLPSLFALDGEQAQRLLEDQGYDVVVRPARSCEPPGLVVGSDPPSGGPVAKGGAVTVRTSVLSGSHCEPAYPGRSAAWQFLRFVLGRAGPPAFASVVRIVVDGQSTATLDTAAVTDLSRWGDVPTALAGAAGSTVPTDSGMARLAVRTQVPPQSWCGEPRPAQAGARTALRLQILTRAPENSDGCPLTVDLYRSADDSIDLVVVYSAGSQ